MIWLKINFALDKNTNDDMINRGVNADQINYWCAEEHHQQMVEPSNDLRMIASNTIIKRRRWCK